MKQLLLYCLLFCYQSCLWGQQEISISKHFAIYDSIQTQEKIYVQTDRTLYRPGDAVWLNAFVLNGTNCPSELSREVYVELRDPKGSVLKLKILKNEHGLAEGQLVFPATAVEGIYTLRAYSYWMQNFGVAHYFEKKLTVQKVVLPEVLMTLDFEQETYGEGSQVMAIFKARTKDNKALREKKVSFEVTVEGEQLCQEVVQTDEEGQAYLAFKLPEILTTQNVLLNVKLKQDSLEESIARMVPIVLNTLDVQFLPEGGHLIANRINRVAFKVLDEYGKPADIKAQLLDENQKIVSRFESYHQGMGTFEFVPQENRTYQVQVLEPKGIQENWSLPKASKRVGLYLEHQDSTALVLAIYNNNKKLKLIAQQQGNILYTQQVPAKDGTQTYTIPTKNLSMGIVQLTVFDTQQHTLCERLVFVNKHRALNLSLKTNKSTYLPREEVALTLEAKDETGKGVLGNFSLAVVDDKNHTFIDDKQDNILSYLLMSSDLKGQVYEPNFYFDPNEPKADTALDYVLLTHGWRRYDWDTLLQENPAIWTDKIDFEIASDEISGYLKINRYLHSQKLILLSERRPVYKKKDALMATWTNKNGFFKFKKKGLKFPVYITLRHENKGHVIKVREYSKSGLELVRKTDLKEMDAQKSKATESKGYTSIDLNQGQLYGAVWDVDMDEGLPFANVVLEKEGVQITGTQTDFDGNYIFDSIPAGTYDLMVSYVGYPSIKTEGIPIKNTYKLELDVEMSEGEQGYYNRLPTEEFILLDAKEAEQYKKSLTENENNQNTDNLILLSSLGAVLYGNFSIPDIDIEEVQMITLGVPAAFENNRSINSIIMSTGRPAGGLSLASSSQEIMVRSYRIPLIDQSNTSGGQILTSADIVPGGGWGGGAISSGANYYQSHSYQYDQVTFEQVGKGITFSENQTFYEPQYSSQEVVETRTDFRKTIYWNPRVKTNKEGKASLKYYNSDAVTTFRAIVEGGSFTGLVGRTEHTYSVERPFSLTVRVPAVLSAWDTLEIPVLLKNTSEQDIEGILSIDSIPSIQVLTDLKTSIRLAKKSSKIIYVQTVVKNKRKEDQLKISFKGDGMRDVIQQKIEIVSKGFPSSFALSGKDSLLQDTFILPAYHEGSLIAEFKVYSTILDDLIEGTRGMMRSPYGCFEQVSSANYPNILALQVLKEKGAIHPDIQARAQRYLKTGYQKLTGYEIKGGGFEWYGRAPAHEGLTAYGLVQLNEMKGVYEGVEEAVLERTKAFLLSRRDGDGGYVQNVGKYGFSGNKKALFNTYITWALSEVGVREIEVEVEKAVREAIESKDLYRLSLACLTLYNRNEKKQAEKLLKYIVRQISVENLSEILAESTITHSYGNALNIETLSFAALAMMRSSTTNPKLLNAIQKHIISKRSYGRFGNTQSTVMALKMLLEYQEKYIEVQEGGELSVYINNVLAKDLTYEKGVQNKISFSNLASYLRSGENIIQIKTKGSLLPCAFETEWKSIEKVSNFAQNLKIQTILKDKITRVGEVVMMDVKLSNLESKAQTSPMATIGIPAGLSLQAWQLKKLQEEEAFAYYEIKNNQLILYFRNIGPKEVKKLNLYLKAEVPGTYQAPANSAYLYYMDELKSWEAGIAIKILKG